MTVDKDDSMSGAAPASLTVRSYDPDLADSWDNLVARSVNGTLMHTRRFISYHGDRFQDRSLLIEDRRGRTVGVFPAAQDLADEGTVVSHPGLTYGGIVHDGSIAGASMIEALTEASTHYRGIGYGQLRYKAVPGIYHSLPAADDLYALFRLGGRCYRSDLSATIDLAQRGAVSQRRARSRKRAEAAGVRVAESWAGIAEFWHVLEQNLASRHDASPVHSLDEIQLLHERFPDEILLVIAEQDGTLIGGTVLLSAGPVLHMQYTATTSQGRDNCATDPVMEYGIDLARKRGFRYFDFGTCTVDGGWTLDQDLYNFKASFGASGIVYEHFELSLG